MHTHTHKHTFFFFQLKNTSVGFKCEGDLWAPSTVSGGLVSSSEAKPPLETRNQTKSKTVQMHLHYRRLSSSSRQTASSSRLLPSWKVELQQPSRWACGPPGSCCALYSTREAPRTATKLCLSSEDLKKKNLTQSDLWVLRTEITRRPWWWRSAAAAAAAAHENKTPF